MSESTASGLAARLSNLNPFSKNKPRREIDDEDAGEEIDNSTVAGGGHSSRQTDITKNKLQVSSAIRAFLVNENVLSERDASLGNPEQMTQALQELVDKPHFNVPASVTDRSHPLPDYFISSSHNTYLKAHQLYGSSSADAYETALNTGSRCVEIDAWDDDDNIDEPKVTHGYTLVSNIPFRAVCETIRNVVDKEAQEAVDEQGYRAAPVVISLENHCGPQGQLRLVQIMKETWGDRLLSEAIRQEGHREQAGSGEHVKLSELGSKIVVIVEYHTPDEVEDSDSTSSSESEDEDEKNARKTYKDKSKETASTAIIPELADLGVYAQSVKPGNKSWYDQIRNPDEPHHPLINVSETGLISHMPVNNDKIALHNAYHLMRVYPKGNRISSKNLNPVPFWGIGAQICALNWQTFGASMQINEALFTGSDGFVLKPASLRHPSSSHDNRVLSSPAGKKKKLTLHVAGASSIPMPSSRDDDKPIKPYLSCTLIHPSDLRSAPKKQKTNTYKQTRLTDLLKQPASNIRAHTMDLKDVRSPPVTDPIWNTSLSWEYEDNELVFLRLLIKSDDSFSRNPVLCVGCVRVLYTQEVKGWRVMRMLDLGGRETRCGLWIKFEVEDI